jgi:hypothetical protein
MENEKINGHIYLVTSEDTGKKYVGQTRSHVFNNGKYRPYGVIGRWKKHVSAALTGGSQPLHQDIRKFGPERFKVELLKHVLVEELDEQETSAILWLDTLSPNGYNVQEGGNVTSKKGIPKDVQGRDKKRKRKYEEEEVEKASIHEVEGVAPKVIVFFQTPSKKTIREMPRTTFSAQFGREEAMNKAFEFAREYTDNVDFSKNHEDRKNEAASSMDEEILGAVIRKKGSRYVVWFKTPTKSTTRTMKMFTFHLNKSKEDDTWDRVCDRAVEFARQYTKEIDVK